jgi:hypothetical protein
VVHMPIDLRRDRRRPSLLGVGLGVLVSLALLAACGNTASTAPSATPEGPTPTPIDLERAFLAAVTGSGFSASGTISGTATIGAASGTIAGTFKGNADDFEQVVTLTAGSAVQSIDRIVTANGGWERFGTGPWLALPPPAEPPVEGASLFAWLQTLEDLEIAGTDARDGVPVVHLTRLADALPIPPEAIGFDTSDVTAPQISIELFAAVATGAPVAIDVTAAWTQTVLSVPTAATYSFSYAFSGVGEAVTIEAPEDIWVLNANLTLGYQIAMPEGWTVAAEGDRDAYSIDGVPTVFVRANGNATGLTLDEFRAAITAAYHTEFGSPASVTASTLSGAPANFLKYGVSSTGGTPKALLDRIAIHGPGWEVSMVTPAGPTTEDLDLFETFCASFAFTK